MIEVQNLSKLYGDALAVNDVSFAVEPGEIVGFLGPNGAGKTTTMRILTGFMAPSAGTARVNGFDILDKSMEARRSIGYLPENAPLYSDMSVRDYLMYVAALRGVPRKQRAERLEAALDAGKLEDRADTIIRKLSKGYRQRVGIAQAVVHDPPVLIFDEPSSGLDPRQRVETRRFISSLAPKHTVVLSTHILPDVQETCSRVVVIAGGRIVAQETTENLAAQNRLSLQLARPGDDVEIKLRRVAGITNVEQRDGSWLMETTEHADPREAIAHLCVEEGWGLLELSRRRADLEEAFLQLTTRE